MVADERLGQAHMGDELGDARFTLREAPHDPQAVHIGEGLVEGTKLSQVLGLEDDRGEGGSESSGGRQDLETPNGDVVRRINDG